MKTLKLFAAVSLIVLMAVSLSHCTFPSTETPAPPVETSVPPTAVATALPTAPPPNEDYLEVFEVVWQTVDQTYFDPEFGGLDWQGVHDDYEPLVAAAQDDETLYQILNQMMWELNVSHTGVGRADGWRVIEPVAFARGEIGVDVRLLGDQAVITRVEAGSPAGEAGLRPGFVIQRIEGVPVEQIIATAEGRLGPPYNERGRIDGLTRQLLGLIYGDPGTSVSLSYLDENDVVHEQSFERARRGRMSPLAGIPLPAAYLEFESLRLENGIGYIRFNMFHPNLIPDMADAVAAFQDAPGIIIDLRGNAGGDSGTGEQMAAQFLEQNTPFGTFISREESWETVIAGEGIYTGTVVILIDTLSYSCSEWFSSGMQASGRATIVGQRSPGGATGMNIATLPNGALLGYPVLKLITPDGIVLEGHGVIPDIAVSLDRVQLLQGIDAQLEAGVGFILDAVQE